MTWLLKMFGVVARLLAYAVALACLLGATLAVGGAVSPWLDLFTHFAPLWFAGALIVTVMALAFAPTGDRRALAVLGGLGVVIAAALMAPELTRPIDRPSPAAAGDYRLRLIQFNAWDENPDPAAAADWISAQRPNIVTIEEITPALRQAMLGHGFAAIKGVVGVAIFSRDIPVTPRFIVPFQDWKILPDFARASFVTPDGRTRFSVIAVHLNWPTIASHWRKPEAFARLLDLQPRDDLIVAGDFNLTPWSFALRGLDRRLDLERRDRAIATWPAMRDFHHRIVKLAPFLPIDHVYAGRAWRTVRIARGPRLGSDHYPLIVDLALSPGARRPPG